MKGYPFWLKCNWRLEQVAFLEMEESHNVSKSVGCSLKKEWICQQRKLVASCLLSSKL